MARTALWSDLENVRLLGQLILDGLSESKIHEEFKHRFPDERIERGTIPGKIYRDHTWKQFKQLFTDDQIAFMSTRFSHQRVDAAEKTEERERVEEEREDDEEEPKGAVRDYKARVTLPRPGLMRKLTTSIAEQERAICLCLNCGDLKRSARTYCDACGN